MSIIISNFIILIFENIAIIMYILQSKKFLSISYIIYIFFSWQISSLENEMIHEYFN